jgi:exonuclease SbcD
MKIIHLSDLHIGKVVHGFSLIEDQQYIFKQMIALIKSVNAGAIIIAGDVYDRQTPGVEAVKLFDEFLTDLSELHLPILLISGNHDSPERLGFASRILQQSNIYFASNYAASPQCVTLTDEYGEIDFYLLPFLRPMNVRAFTKMPIETYQQAFDVALSDTPKDPARRNVLITHQFIISTGYEPLRSESEHISVGGIDSINISPYQDNFDYIALGHIHGPQNVGSPTVRYCGTPLKYSFSEHLHEKSLTVVDLKEKGDVNVSTVRLLPLRDMRRIKGPFDELISPAVYSQANCEDYVHICLTDETEIFDAMNKVRIIYPNTMLLTYENQSYSSLYEEFIPSESNDEAAMSLITPFELFCEFYLSQNGVSLNPNQLDYVTELFNISLGDHQT